MNPYILAILRAFQPIDYYSADISGLERKYAKRLQTWR
jgi:hypothetical protein